MDRLQSGAVEPADQRVDPEERLTLQFLADRGGDMLGVHRVEVRGDVVRHGRKATGGFLSRQHTLFSALRRAFRGRSAVRFWP